MAEKLFSVVIPTVGRHDKFLLKLISDLRRESNLVGEVVVVRSDLNSKLSTLYKIPFFILSLILRPGFEVKVLTVPKKQTAGQNRNTGWKVARFEFTAFLDADDLYHRQRLTIINELLHFHPNANLILHLYSFDEIDISSSPLLEEEIISNDSINTSISADSRNVQQNWETPGIYNLSAVGKNGEFLKIHHGHATVRSKLKNSFQYSNIPKGEDGLFASEILVKIGEVFIISRELSFYRNFYSSFAPNMLKRNLLIIRDAFYCIFHK
jgi:glycosyltransferase involved in cell wall biosynthesis